MALEENVKEFGVAYFGLGDSRQGIVHIIGPEQEGSRICSIYGFKHFVCGVNRDLNRDPDRNPKPP